MLTVIVPVYNGGVGLARCLAAIRAGTRQPDELIVVDDASTDGSAEVAANYGARVVSLAGEPRGPARARNRGVSAAEGDLLVFVDADVAVQAEAVARLDARLLADATLDGVFGSYDDHPTDASLVSQYKNLQHHWVHQHSGGPAHTFWAGCGAVRRAAFEAVGGYDERFERPAIEDIDFGLRLRDAGFRLELDPAILCTHLKRWTLHSLLQADISGRAIPWSRLIAARGEAPHSLNLDRVNRWSGALAWIGLIALCAAPWWPIAMAPAGLALPGMTLAAVLWLNRAFYRFLRQRGGRWLQLVGVLLHLGYYVYATAIFGCVAGPALLRRLLPGTTKAQP
jgi:glycosyltransferase involved in cell wall biosynthesis